MKADILIPPDPKSREEALDRASSVHALARESREPGDTVSVESVGASIRRPAEVAISSHHTNRRLNDVRQQVILRTGQ